MVIVSFTMFKLIPSADSRVHRVVVSVPDLSFDCSVYRVASSGLQMLLNYCRVYNAESFPFRVLW